MSHAVGTKNPFLVTLDTGRHPPTASVTPVGDLTMPEECREEITDLRRRGDALQAQNEDLINEMKDLQTKNENLIDKNSALQAQIDKLRLDHQFKEYLIRGEEKKHLEELAREVNIWLENETVLRDFFQNYGKQTGLSIEEKENMSNDYISYSTHMLDTKRKLETLKRRLFTNEINVLSDKMKAVEDILKTFDN